MRLSAVIPTHDRPDLLRDCLATLRDQDVAPGRLEVIVVDDGSATDIGAVVEDVARGGPVAMSCVRQPLAGLNEARNNGAAASSGEVVAFLDDDTLVESGWARAMLSAFEREPCAAVGGRVELELATSEPAWMTEWRCYLAEYDLGNEKRWLDPDDPVPVGANCAVRRQTLVQFGGFRVGLDRIGRSLVSNGDTEFFRRVRAGGGCMLYVPDANVRHRVPASRMTIEYFVARHRAQGVSDELMLRLEGHRASWGHRYGLAREAIRSGRSWAFDRALGRPPVRDRLLLSYWTGRLSATRVAGGSPTGDRAPR